jgi:hypothetical protein
MRIVVFVVAIAFAVCPTAHAQALTKNLPLRNRVSSEPLSMAQGQAVGGTQGRDSLWNGLASGASVGALLGALIGRGVEVNNRNSGQAATVSGAVIGAGLGAAVGAGIDVLLNRKSGIPHRISMSPVLTHDVRAFNTQVRF